MRRCSCSRTRRKSSPSRACYLNGSFGSGKSHFMAVLHLLLQGNLTARGIPELADTVAKHNTWTAGKKFLLVPYYLIRARSLQSAVLGGYADYIRQKHPEAPSAPIYRAEALFAEPRRKARIGAGWFRTWSIRSSPPPRPVSSSLICLMACRSSAITPRIWATMALRLEKEGGRRFWPRSQGRTRIKAQRHSYDPTFAEHYTSKNCAA